MIPAAEGTSRDAPIPRRSRPLSAGPPKPKRGSRNPDVRAADGADRHRAIRPGARVDAKWTSKVLDAAREFFGM